MGVFIFFVVFVMQLLKLNHSAGSTLCQLGVNMKEIQEWLGHSDFSTTANRYSHLTSDTKKSTMASMVRTLGLSAENVTVNSKEEATSES